RAHLANLPAEDVDEFGGRDRPLAVRPPDRRDAVLEGGERLAQFVAEHRDEGVLALVGGHQGLVVAAEHRGAPTHPHAALDEDIEHGAAQFAGGIALVPGPARGFAWRAGAAALPARGDLAGGAGITQDPGL